MLESLSWTTYACCGWRRCCACKLVELVACGWWDCVLKKFLDITPRNRTDYQGLICSSGWKKEFWSLYTFRLFKGIDAKIWVILVIMIDIPFCIQLNCSTLNIKEKWWQHIGFQGTTKYLLNRFLDTLKSKTFIGPKYFGVFLLFWNAIKNLIFKSLKLKALLSKVTIAQMVFFRLNRIWGHLNIHFEYW